MHTSEFTCVIMVMYWMMPCVHEPLEWVGRVPMGQRSVLTNQPTLVLEAIARHLRVRASKCLCHYMYTEMRQVFRAGSRMVSPRSAWD